MKVQAAITKRLAPSGALCGVRPHLAVEDCQLSSLEEAHRRASSIPAARLWSIDKKTMGIQRLGMGSGDVIMRLRDQTTW